MDSDSENDLLKLQKQWVGDSDAMMLRQWEHVERYANLLIIAGYAGLFGVWNFVHDKLPSKVTAMAAVLLILSIVVFVLFEVFKGYRFSKEWNRHFGGRSESMTHLEAIEHIKKARRVGEDLEKSFVAIWEISFTIALLLGGVAMLILLSYLGFILGST